MASTINKYVKPRIFEIGRTQATLLGTENKDDPDKWIKCKIDEKHGGTSDKLCKEKTWRDMVNDLITGLFNPKDSTTSTKSEIQVLIKFLILVVFFGAMYIAVFILNKKTAFQLSSTSSNSLNNNDNWGIKQNIWYIILSVIVIALFFGFVLVDNFEPFMWLEGVSIWPNLAIRLVGVLVIMYFSNYFYFKLRYHKRIISRATTHCPCRRSRG